MQVQVPVTASHSYRQQLVASPEDVFPLLCPVRECDWVNGWQPRLVISASGVAEKNCVFIMPGEPAEAIWVVTEFLPPHRICFVKVTPGLSVGTIEIELSAAPGGAYADVTYTFTALSAEGVAAVRAFTTDYYHSFMVEWETELNHYLHTGEKLPAEAVA